MEVAEKRALRNTDRNISNISGINNYFYENRCLDTGHYSLLCSILGIDRRDNEGLVSLTL